MKEYLNNMKRFRQSLVALQLIAASESVDVRVVRELMFVSTLIAAYINKQVTSRFHLNFYLFVPLTSEQVGCGMHNAVILNYTLAFSARKTAFQPIFFVISLRTRLFLSRQLSISFFIEVRTILKDYISFFVAFLMYLTILKMPKYNMISHLFFLFNMCQSPYSVSPCIVEFATLPLFVIAGLDFVNSPFFFPLVISAFVLTICELLQENQNASVIYKLLSLTDAVNNCDEMLAEITARYNRLRQESITNALLELNSYVL